MTTCSSPTRTSTSTARPSSPPCWWSASPVTTVRATAAARWAWATCSIGAAAVAADYNGVPKASHIKDKIIEMIHLNETMYSCGIACSAEGTKTASGNYLINLLLANVCKQNVTRFPDEMARIAEDLAGGAVGTCLSGADLKGEFTGPGVQKYMKNGTGTTAEDRMRDSLRLIEHGFLPGRRGCGLPHRVPPRGWLSPGPAGHDRPPG